MIDDEEIIAAIQEAPVALDSIQNLFNYLEQNSDIKINNSTISGMRNLQYQIKRKQNASLKQSTLEAFFYNNNK